MEPDKTSITGSFKKLVRRRLVAGLLVILPIYVTYFIIKFLISLLGGILSPVVEKIIKLLEGPPPSNAVEEFVVTVIAFILALVVLYFIGLFAANLAGKYLINFYESILNRMPIVKNIYASSKQLIHMVSLPSGKAFKRVVVVDYPRVGMKVFAFVTGNIKSKDGTQLTSIFIPTTPNPTSGFLIYLPEGDITETNMTIEEGMKLIVSGGILVPEDVIFSRGKIANN